MTVIEMNHSVLLKLKTLDRVDIKDPNSYDIVTLMNNAQDIIVDELVINKKYEYLRPITESISTLAASFDSSYTSGINGADIIDLSGLAVTANTEYRNYIRSQSKITKTYAPTISSRVYLNNQEISKEELNIFEYNGTNRPIFTNPKALLEGDYLIVVPDYYTTISEIISVVVRTPKILDLTTNTGAYTTTCELPVELHQIIVDKTVQLFAETINVNDIKK